MFGPLFDWIDAWEMTSRIQYLGTMLFLHNFQKAMRWFLTATRTVFSILSFFVAPMARPFAEFIELFFPLWNMFVPVAQDFFTVIWTVIESSFTMIGDVLEIFLLPVWYFFTVAWNLATTFVYPVAWVFVYAPFRLLFGFCSIVMSSCTITYALIRDMWMSARGISVAWVFVYAPFRLLFGFCSIVMSSCTITYALIRVMWMSARGIFQVMRSVHSTVSTVEISMWRSLWNDLFSHGSLQLQLNLLSVVEYLICLQKCSIMNIVAVTTHVNDEERKIKHYCSCHQETMGIFHSTNTRFTYEEEEEEEEVDDSAVYPNLHSRGYRSYGVYSLPLLSFTSIYNATKGLLQKLCLVINFFRPRTSPKDSFLPIQNQASKQPLLVPSPLLSSPTADSILEKTFQSLTDSSCINDDCHVSCSQDGEISEDEEDVEVQEVKNIVAVTTHVNDDCHVSCSQDRDISEEESEDEEHVEVQEVKNIVAVTTHVNDEERKIKHYCSCHQETMGIFRSTNTRFTYEEEEEEEVDDSAVYPNLHSRGYRSYGVYSLPLLSFTSIYNATKGLLQKLCLVINFFRPRTSPKDSFLPTQNQASKQPLLVPSPLLSSLTTDTILEKTFQSLTDSSCINDDCHVSCSQDGEISEDEEDVEVQVVKNIVAVTTHVNDDCHVSCSQDRDISEEESEDEEHVEVQEVKNIVAVTTHVNDEERKIKHYCSCHQEDKALLQQEVKNIIVAVTSDEERKIKHYSSRHRILLVGEGDFSFSACLAIAFGDATNIIATSLNTKAFLKKHYGKAMSNIAEIRSRGGKVMHEIDATDIANHESLKHLKFHRIIFNFPYAGLFHKMSAECQLGLHRRLVSKFLQNAKAMISEEGEIHVSHKTNGFHAEFKLESIASSHGLRLIQAVKFKKDHYPGYNTKYGFGGDGNFDCNPSKTFKFGLKTAPLC